MNTTYLYIRLYPNKMIIRDVCSHREVTETAEVPFTTSRLLVGDMLSAAKTLQKAVLQLDPPRPLWKKLLPQNYAVLIHPMEMREGGLCNVEKRIFRELAGFISARKQSVKAWVCDHPEIQPDQFVSDVLSGRFKGEKEDNTSTD
ncbi:hypothetical protein [Morganella psychrotolerans]|uniref:1-pyrroline-5-carboxylate dehydrogenase n=1 Tax=Morganella psychrotolerans TaxID=368603 RepID=A0A1B8HQI4_9GAMM|nr:hypothetical protein [Morganella psychrotolerans]OBU11755.1 hypothetical protein AYY17_03365 [Morganella psychrotolerans]